MAEVALQFYKGWQGQVYQRQYAKSSFAREWGGTSMLEKLQLGEV